MNNVLATSIIHINKCYHGMSTPDPCFENVTEIAGSIWGHWQAVDGNDQPIPWTIDFTPNGIFDIRNGTLSMATIGPASHGSYRIVPEGGEHPKIYVDMENGKGFKATITLYSLRELLLSDDNGTTYFHRWGL